MRSIRLNTYLDSIERGGVPVEPRRAFQPRDQTPRDGPETHGSKPTRYPGTLADGCPDDRDEPKAPVFCGRANGAEPPKSEGMAAR